MQTLAWVVGTALCASVLVWIGGRVWLSDTILYAITALAALGGALLGAWPSLPLKGRRDETPARQ